MNLLLQILRWANIFLVLVTLLAYLSPLINPAKSWHFTFFGLAYPVLLVGNVLFIVFWAFQMDRYFLFSSACILVGFGYFTSFFGFHFFKSQKKEAGEITVMTYNVAGFKNLGSKDQARMADIKAALGQIIEKHGEPEILCIQEGNQTHVMDLLRKTFGYTHHFKHKGTVIFSKYPFVKQDIVTFQSMGNSCIWADLKTPGGVVRVYSAHLQSNSLSFTANRIVTQGSPRKKQTWRDIRFVMKQYKRAVAIRAEQAQAIKAHKAKSPHPVILCGDLNDPPVSFVYRLLSGGMKDSFREKGAGIGSTFNGKLPALRIDYVLTDPAFQVKDHRVPDVELSDHFPVLVRLSW